MITTITAQDLDDAFHQVVAQYLTDERLELVQTRNGLAKRWPGPVIIEYKNPERRILLNEIRNANPFFHLMESLWMLNGECEVAWLSQFNKRMSSFSDDGEILHGAYGYRWRYHFGYDQIETAIEKLAANHRDRRVVIGMWDPGEDLQYQGKDAPCNLMIKLEVAGDRLNMYVFNRSNDAIWGALGANAVHMSFLQEYIACALDVPMGRYYQISADFHIYNDQKIDRKYLLPERFQPGNMHQDSLFLKADKKLFDTSVSQFIASRSESYRDDLIFFEDYHKFISSVAVPMKWAYLVKDMKESMNIAREIAHPGWRFAAVRWIGRNRK